VCSKLSTELLIRNWLEVRKTPARFTEIFPSRAILLVVRDIRLKRFEAVGVWSAGAREPQSSQVSAAIGFHKLHPQVMQRTVQKGGLVGSQIVSSLVF
jgi:hypothetical protein